jgi:hypothetical protein
VAKVALSFTCVSLDTSKSSACEFLSLILCPQQYSA